MTTNPDIVIAPCTHAHCYVWTSEAIEREISDEFSFEVPGAQFMKQKRKGWDGRIRLYNRTTKLIYAGLALRILRWAQKQGYSVQNRLQTTNAEWTDLDTSRLLDRYPVSLEVRDYQRAAITHGLHTQRSVILSPTASGKSLILYYLVRARMEQGPVLLIVPTISLVAQMVKDWIDYGWTDADTHVHRITGGVQKRTKKRIVVSTWQSIFRLDADYFERFETVIGDEAHTYKADSLQAIMKKLPHVACRIGVTGTLDDAKSNKLMVEGVFGPQHRVASTADLQKQGHLTPIEIQAHFLQYNEYDCWLVEQQRRTYADEMDFIVQHPKRLSWLVDFIGRLPGNVLVLFTYVAKHGEPLFAAVKERFGSTRPIYFVSGRVSGEDREHIRALVEHTYHVVLTFGDIIVRCAPDEQIPLSDGTTKRAQDITTTDDVDDSFILNRQRDTQRGESTTLDTGDLTEDTEHVTVGKHRPRKQLPDLGPFDG